MGILPITKLGQTDVPLHCTAVPPSRRSSCCSRAVAKAARGEHACRYLDAEGVMESCGESPNMGYKYSYPTYAITYITTLNLDPSTEHEDRPGPGISHHHGRDSKLQHWQTQKGTQGEAAYALSSQGTLNPEA